MLKKTIVLTGGQPKELKKKIVIEGEEYNLKYPTPEEWLRVKSSMFNGSIGNLSMVNYNMALIAAVVEEKVDIFFLSEDELKELREEIDQFINNVDEEEVELTLQAVNNRWYMVAKDKYLLNGSPDFLGYVKDALKNVVTESIYVSELSVVQAGQVREKVDNFFRNHKPTRKKQRSVKEQSSE